MSETGTTAVPCWCRAQRGGHARGVGCYPSIHDETTPQPRPDVSAAVEVLRDELCTYDTFNGEPDTRAKVDSIRAAIRILTDGEG